MRYFKEIQNGALIFGIGPGGTEISEAEYLALRAELEEKCATADKLLRGEITLEDVPERWREELGAEASAAAARAEEEATVEDYRAALAELGAEI